MNPQSHLIVKGVREGLDAELEWSIIGRLVEACHLLRHKHLMQLLAFAIAHVDLFVSSCSSKMTHDLSRCD